MHETSLVRALLRQVSELLVAHQGTSVKTIHVEMGPLSGVDRTLVEIAFAEQVEGTRCRGATLQVEESSLAAVCRDCGQEFDIDDLRFQCRRCKSPHVRVTRGGDFRLLDVEIQT